MWLKSKYTPIQSLATLLDAPSIFSISMGSYETFSVTIVVYQCNNVSRLMLYKNNTSIIKSQL